MTDEIDDIALLGYSDRLSARPGETIEFKVSCTFEGSVEAWLTRSICADPNPACPGIVEESAEAWFAPHTFPARRQHFHQGSYEVPELPVAQHQSVRLLATVFLAAGAGAEEPGQGPGAETRYTCNGDTKICDCKSWIDCSEMQKKVCSDKTGDCAPDGLSCTCVWKGPGRKPTSGPTYKIQQKAPAEVVR